MRKSWGDINCGENSTKSFNMVWHVKRKELDESVRIVDQMVWSHFNRGRRRPKITFNEIIQRDFLMKDLSPSMTIDQAQ